MEFQPFIRKPFKTQAVMITEDNIVEIAGLIGELKSENGNPFILLNRQIIPNIRRAFVGYYLTLIGEKYRIYAPRVFDKEFVEHSDVITFDFCDDDVDPVVRMELMKQAHELAIDVAVDLVEYGGNYETPVEELVTNAAEGGSIEAAADGLVTSEPFGMPRPGDATD